jgi:hypothetical protein
MATMNKDSEKYSSTIIIKICLIAFFMLLVAVILAPFIAELQINAAQGFAQRYLWQNAQQKFQVAMSIDPFSASVPAGFADFLKNISPNLADENSLLINSVKLYKWALELDPLNAEYALNLAETEIALFMRGQSKDNKLLAEALDYFRRALKNDSNGFNVSYSVGYAGISVWDKLDASEKKLVLDRLKYIFKTKPWYSEYIYTHLMQSTKDSEPFRKIRPMESEQEKREKLNRIERVKQSNPSQLWQGKSGSGNDIYENGNMNWSGVVNALLNAPEGEATVIIQAKGSPADDIWPYMIVELDGQEIGETLVDSIDWKEYSFPIKTNSGLKVLSVTFFNDGVNVQRNEDRNLYVGEARIIKNE